MPVVIQDFEVVAEAPTTQRDSGEQTEETAPSAVIEPVTVAQVMRVLEVRELRVWAH